MTTTDIIAGIDEFIDLKLESILGSNPLTSLMHPFIKRVAKHVVKDNITPYTDKLNSYLKLVEDDNGSLDNVFDELIERFNTMKPSTLELPSVGNVTIGEGKAVMSVAIPMGGVKHITFIDKDFIELKDMITNKIKK